MEKLVRHKGHIMGLKNVKNPLKASCVSRSIFSDGFVCIKDDLAYVYRNLETIDIFLLNMGINGH